jgi:hypothetical protein
MCRVRLLGDDAEGLDMALVRVLRFILYPDSDYTDHGD